MPYVFNRRQENSIKGNNTWLSIFFATSPLYKWVISPVGSRIWNDSVTKTAFIIRIFYCLLNMVFLVVHTLKQGRIWKTIFCWSLLLTDVYFLGKITKSLVGVNVIFLSVGFSEWNYKELSRKAQKPSLVWKCALL